MNILQAYKDLQLKHEKDLFKLIKSEHIHQIGKWGVQERTIFEWLTYTTEELGELAEAVSDLQYENDFTEIQAKRVQKEAIQVATLAIKIAEMMYPLMEKE